jgi:hypothetical protein
VLWHPVVSHQKSKNFRGNRRQHIKMLDVAIGVILNLVAFAGIGIGPALIFLSAKKRLEVAVAIAPALGFALTSALATYLVLLDKPVCSWAIPWLIISIVTSSVLSLLWLRRYKPELALVDWQLIKFYLIALGLTTVLMSAPMIVGGIDFTTLRGHGLDDFNYIIMAGYLDREPYSWASQVDIPTLIDRHPLYWIAKPAILTRWTTSAMLAFTARIGGLPIYHFEHGFTILCFILACGPVFWLALSTGIRSLYAALLTIAIAVGFWAQWILDVRAMSQMSSMATVLLIALLIARIESNQSMVFPGELMLLPITAIALVNLYPETLPMVALGVGIFFITRFVRGLVPIQRVGAYFLSLVITILGLLPNASFLTGFLTSQVQFAAGNTSHMSHVYFFPWLYQNPITGIWGLSYFSADETIQRLIPSSLLQAFLIPVGVILLVILAYGLVKVFSKKGYPEETLIISSFTLAALIQFLFLARQGTSGQLWAAGKGLAFGYAFLMASTAVYGLSQGVFPKRKWLDYLSKLAKLVVIFWLVTQCFFGLYRVNFAMSGKVYSNYMGNHADYRQHDWNVESFKRILGNRRSTLWLLGSNIWVAEYLSLAFGWDVNLVNFVVGRDFGGAEYSDIKNSQQALSRLPDHVIVEKKLWQNLDEVSSNVVAKNSDLLLVETPKSFWNKPILLALLNPYGLESDERGNSYFFMGETATHLRLFSPSDGEVTLTAKFIRGPSLPEKGQRNVLINSSANSKTQNVIISESTREIKVPVRQGFNQVSLQVTDKATVKMLPNGETRPMLLRVENLKLSI